MHIRLSQDLAGRKMKFSPLEFHQFCTEFSWSSPKQILLYIEGWRHKRCIYFNILGYQLCCSYQGFLNSIFFLKINSSILFSLHIYQVHTKFRCDFSSVFYSMKLQKTKNCFSAATMRPNQVKHQILFYGTRLRTFSVL